jgi:regulatory protein YycI of two-component signal transduction system YycFG
MLHTYVYDGESYQLMQINKKCRWQRFQQVGESLPRFARGVDYTT